MNSPFLTFPRKNLFIFGKPGSGKTTLIKRLLASGVFGSFNIKGFYTKELREKGERIGFSIVPVGLEEKEFSSKELLFALRKDLAHFKRFPKNFSVGKYYVNLLPLENLIQTLKKSLREKVFWVIDEIGKMEAYSEEFSNFIREITERNTGLLATLSFKKEGVIKWVWNEARGIFCEITKENRDFLLEKIQVDVKRYGVLIVFEGIDGSGKTSLCQEVYAWLKEIFGKEKVILSQEPTEGPYGKKLREILEKRLEVSPERILELFLKDREEHVKGVILPALKEEKIVLLDRYYISTLVYQSLQGLPLKELFIRNETFCPLPDLVIYVDISPDEALKRIQKRGQETSLFEKREKLGRLREIYLKIIPEFRYLKVPGELSLKEVLSEVKIQLSQILQLKALK